MYTLLLIDRKTLRIIFNYVYLNSIIRSIPIINPCIPLLAKYSKQLAQVKIQIIVLYCIVLFKHR